MSQFDVGAGGMLNSRVATDEILEARSRWERYWAVVARQTFFENLVIPSTMSIVNDPRDTVD